MKILSIWILRIVIVAFLNWSSYCNIYKDHPNILLLILDDLRPVLGCYRDSLAITPHIDVLAGKGIIFTKAYAQQALCGPSRTSFLTSRRPDTTQLIDTHYYWRKHAGNFTSLPQYFKEHGYATQSIGKVFHPGTASNKSDDQPYSWSEAPYHPPSENHKNDPVCPSSDGSLHTNIYCPVQVDRLKEKTLPDIQSTEFALEWLHKRAEKQGINCTPSSSEADNRCDDAEPFFLAVGLHKPHIPLKFPMEFLDLFPIDSVPPLPNGRIPDGLPTVAWNPWNDLRRRDDISSLNVSFPCGPIPDFYSRYLRQGYYAATTYADALIGLIVWQTRRLFPDTVIALIGDHGWALGEHQEWSKFSNSEVATQVPFIISLPERSKPLQKSVLKDGSFKITSGYFKNYLRKYKSNRKKKRSHHQTTKQYDGVVELLDLFPTLVDLAGLPALPSCPSESSNVPICTEGISLLCIIQSLLNERKNNNWKNASLLLRHRNDFHSFPISSKYDDPKVLKHNKQRPPACPHKTAAVSQYPRPGINPSIHPDSDQPTLKETNIMGYSIRTHRYRYTIWAKFNHSAFKADFSNKFGEELYDHLYDNGENKNLATTQKERANSMKEYLRFIFK